MSMKEHCVEATFADKDGNWHWGEYLSQEDAQAQLKERQGEDAERKSQLTEAKFANRLQALLSLVGTVAPDVVRNPSFMISMMVWCTVTIVQNSYCNRQIKAFVPTPRANGTIFGADTSANQTGVGAFTVVTGIMKAVMSFSIDLPRVAAQDGGCVGSAIYKVGSSSVLSVGGFITFFIVFYSNQCFNRWWQQYMCCTSCQGRIFDVASLLRANLEDEDMCYASQVVRYANCAHILGYVGLSPAGQDYNGALFCALAHRHGLLTAGEAAQLKEVLMEKTLAPKSTTKKSQEAGSSLLYLDLSAEAGALKRTMTKVEKGEAVGAGFDSIEAGLNGGSTYRLMIVWALHSVAVLRKTKKLPPDQVATLEQNLLALRGSMARLYHHEFQPIPFAYFHLMCWLLLLYLPVFSFWHAANFHEAWHFAWIAPLTLNISLIGLQELAMHLQRPFGHDHQDFCVLHFMSFACTMSRKLLLASIPSVHQNLDARFLHARRGPPPVQP